MLESKGRPERKGRMEGTVAIVTGAGSSGPGIGNGKAAAVLFAREGSKVLLVAQVLARAEETLELIHQEGYIPPRNRGGGPGGRLGFCYGGQREEHCAQ